MSFPIVFESKADNLRVAIVDTHTEKANKVASYLVWTPEAAAFVDVGSSHGVPHLLAALQEHHVPVSQVRYVAVTHIHLDHMGGTGTLLKALPAATVLCHPVGQRHLEDPSVLVEAYKNLMGEKHVSTHYHPIENVPPERIRPLEHDESVSLGPIRLAAHHATGHAPHHTLYRLEGAGGQCLGVFVGDALGACYSFMRTGGLNPPYILPHVSAPFLDTSLWFETWDQLDRLAPRILFLPHFGTLDYSPDITAKARKIMSAYADLVAPSIPTVHESDLVMEILALYPGRISREEIICEDAEVVASSLAGWHRKQKARAQRK